MKRNIDPGTRVLSAGGRYRKIRGRVSWAVALTATAGLAAAVGVLPGAAAAATPKSAAATKSTAPAVPVLDWKPCDDGFYCATARVPLNYSDPRGAQVSIALISSRATGPGPSLGWLFFNGGGPNPQVSTMPGVYPNLPALWRERYNIITFDPRGMGYSTQVRCFPTQAAENALLGDLPAFPVGTAQQAAYDRAYATLDARCAGDAGPLLGHDSSADIARDLNLLREAVGDPVLNYYGASYATLFGAIYANLFPATTGRMILDGNLNPVAWSTGDSQVPAFARLDSPQASAATMAAFLHLCGQASTKACAFSATTPAATTAKWNTLLRLVSKHPVNLGGQQGTYTYPDVVEFESGSLDSVAQWQSSAVLLQQLWTVANGGKPSPSPSPSPSPHPAALGSELLLRRRAAARHHVRGQSEPARLCRLRRRRGGRHLRADRGVRHPGLCGLAGRRGPGPLHRTVEPAHRQHDPGDRQHRRPPSPPTRTRSRCPTSWPGPGC